MWRDDCMKKKGKIKQNDEILKINVRGNCKM